MYQAVTIQLREMRQPVKGGVANLKRLMECAMVEGGAKFFGLDTSTMVNKTKQENVFTGCSMVPSADESL
jgi:hypothetical protein